MSAIEWQPAILSDAAPGVAPSTTRDIANAFDGESSSDLSMSFIPVGGTSPKIEVTLWIWTGNVYVETGDVFLLEPGVNNFVEVRGGVFLAVTGTPTGSPTSYEVLLGRRAS